MGHDGPNNTFSAIRIISEEQDLLYVEFADVTNPDAWNFSPESINFYELYNVTSDYYMLNNIYPTASGKLKHDLHNRLHRAIACQGHQDCSTILSGNEKHY